MTKNRLYPSVTISNQRKYWHFPLGYLQKPRGMWYALHCFENKKNAIFGDRTDDCFNRPLGYSETEG